MQEAVLVPDAELAEQARTDPDVARVLEDSKEIWRNDQYVAIVRRFPEGGVASLSIRRDDRKAIRDWRHLQRVKNDIAGPHVEAVELFPDEDRLLDTANQYWLWCMPPGVRMPLGWDTKRIVDGDNDPRFPRSQQRPIEDEQKENDA